MWWSASCSRSSTYSSPFWSRTRRVKYLSSFPAINRYIPLEQKKKNKKITGGVLKIIILTMENRLGTFTSPSGGYNRGCPWWNCMERWNKWNGWISTLASAASNMVIERYTHIYTRVETDSYTYISLYTIHNSMFICNGHCCQRVRLSSRRLGGAGRLSWWCGVVHPSCRTYRKVPKLSHAITT